MIKFLLIKSDPKSLTLTGIVLCITILVGTIARIAQSVEQWTENPRVTSSNLVPGTICHYFGFRLIYSYIG